MWDEWTFAHFVHFLFELIFRNCDVFGMMFMFFFIAAFAPMNGGTAYELPNTNSWKQPFDAQWYFSHSESDWQDCVYLNKEKEQVETIFLQFFSQSITIGVNALAKTAAGAYPITIAE